MEPDPTVLASLRKAVEAMPDDVPLRVHLATLLLQAGQRDEAIRHVGAVLQRDPGNTEALALLQRPAAPAPSPSAPQVRARRPRRSHRRRRSHRPQTGQRDRPARCHLQQPGATQRAAATRGPTDAGGGPGRAPPPGPFARL